MKGKTHKLALKELSLAIDTGEVFGLLGHNGAGKTTTMKIIIAEEAASRGRVRVSKCHQTLEIPPFETFPLPVDHVCYRFKLLVMTLQLI